jgi:hypothetical protein
VITNLSLCATSIKEAAVLLKLQSSEQDVVNNVIERLAPEQWSRFVFQHLPTSFAELDRLDVHDQNFAFTDQLRQTHSDHSQMTQRAEVNSSPLLGRSNLGPRQSSESVERRVIRCFPCNQPGHVQRNCPLPASQRRDVAARRNSSAL